MNTASMNTAPMDTASMTIDDVREVLVRAIAEEASVAPEDLATDRTFTSYGLDSMAALSVGIEIEDSCGLSDLPTNLMWDYPTVDTLTDALWLMISGQASLSAAEGR